MWSFLHKIWKWLGHFSTVAWLWSLFGASLSVFVGSLLGELRPWQLAFLGVSTFLFVLAGIGTWVRPVWETRNDSPPSVAEVNREKYPPPVNLMERMSSVPGLRVKYPTLLGITPPSVIGDLGTYIQSWYRDRRLGRPEDGPTAVAYDNETLVLFEEEFEDAIEAVRDYLDYRGVHLDTDVANVGGIRPFAKRLEEASDFAKWPNFP